MTVRALLHVVTTLDRGGAEKALLALVRSFRSGPRADRWSVAVAYLKGRGELRAEFEAEGVAVHDLDVRGNRAARSRARLARLVREFGAVVVHSHLFKADLLAASVVGRRRPGRAALVSTKHNEDVYLESPLWRALGRTAARRADALIAVSDGVAAFLRRTIGEPPCGIDVVRYGVPAPATPAAPPPGTGVVLCIARLDEQKDHETLLRAVARIAPTRSVRLVLLGRGPQEAALRERVRSLRGVEVEFAGFAEDPTRWFDAADVVALASRWEGLGLVLVEAAQRGRPAVATRVGGIPEAVEDGVTGLLVPPGDDAAFAAALARLLDDQALARRMGDAARERALRVFDPEACAAATEAIYRRTLGDAP